MEHMDDIEPTETAFSSRCANKNLYSCSEPGCNKTFSRPSRLETHILAHTGERPFKCNQCEKSFTRNAHLKRHQMINHDGIKQSPGKVSCDQCDSTFANPYSLKKHVKRFHEVKQYTCRQCEKSFHKRHLLSHHLLEHKGDGFPYSCFQCGKSFKYPMYLKRHERVHRGYVCEICSSTFEKWSDLHHHKASDHTPIKSTETFICSKCNRSFRSKAFLKQHELIHLESRSTYHCPIEFCPRFFYFKKNLDQHIRGYHEGLKYLCSQSGCSSKFYSKQKLLEHLSKSHDIENKETIVKKKSKKRAKRKDKGMFKKPMVSILSGIDCNKSGAAILLKDEKRPLDSLHNISEEVHDFIYNTSEASDSEHFVGCLRGKKDYDDDFSDPKYLIGSLKRMEKDKHFQRRRIEESYLSSDTDCESSAINFTAPLPPSTTTVKSNPCDFSKFLKR